MSDEEQAQQEQDYDNFEDIAGNGYMAHSLTRTNNKIKRDRAESIAEDVKLSYKRKVEDLQMEMRKLQRKQKGLFDFSPESSFSLVLADDVEGVDIVDRDMELALEIRNTKVKLIEAKKRYNHLFGKTYDVEEELV